MLDANFNLINEVSPKLEPQRQVSSGLSASHLSLIGEAVCFHQGELAQYFCLAAELHKKLRLAVANVHPNSETINERHLALAEFLNRNLDRIWVRTQSDLHEYFDRGGRSKNRIRCCIKSTASRDGKEYIVPVFRDANVPYDSSCLVDFNTGFRRIKETGKYFICTDIPAWAKAHNYLNPRLDGDRVKIYRGPNFLQRFRKMPDEEWCMCWKQYGETPNAPQDCYKSTLIIPMTLINNHLDPEFQRITAIGKVGRTHFGFLCFDHQETGFFNEGSDVKIGYIFADLLSLYFITRLVFVTLSSTYNTAIEMTG